MNLLKSISEWLLSNGGILIAAISGIFSVFADHKSGRKWTILVVAGVLFGFFWSLASASYADKQQKQAMEDYNNRVTKFVEFQSNVTVKQTASQVDTNTRAALNDFLTRIFGVRPEVAASASLTQVAAITNAAAAARVSAVAITPDEKKLLTIRVFPHAQQQVDYDVVKLRLQQLAGNVVALPPQQQTAPTNSVWYSGGATLDEAKAVALTAVSAGLNIKQVCPGTRAAGAYLIQIGGSVRAEGKPVLTPEQIRNLIQAPCSGADGG